MQVDNSRTASSAVAVVVSRHSRSESGINRNNKHRQYMDPDRVGER